MGKIKLLTVLVFVGVLSMGTMISCSKEESVREENVITAITPEQNKEKSNYLPLGEDPYADDALEIQERLLDWNFVSEDGKKVAYLTFDDGPSTKVTGEILDVLKENDVKGTFFALGSMIEKNSTAKSMLKRMADEGHAIANHGYGHRYEVLYPGDTVDANAFMDDMNKSLSVMKEVLGEDFNTRVIRFPGGHSNWYTNDIDVVLKEKGYAFVDWNTLTGDADTTSDLTKDELFGNLKQTVSDIDTNNDIIVVLMHDTNANELNAEVVKDTITYLKELGYEFRTLK